MNADNGHRTIGHQNSGQLCTGRTIGHQKKRTIGHQIDFQLFFHFYRACDSSFNSSRQAESNGTIFSSFGWISKKLWRVFGTASAPERDARSLAQVRI